VRWPLVTAALSAGLLALAAAATITVSTIQSTSAESAPHLVVDPTSITGPPTNAPLPRPTDATGPDVEPDDDSDDDSDDNSDSGDDDD
jgi:hypothetical protein